MKKKMLLAWLVAIVATCSQAQYFQSMYSDNSSCGNGMITRSTGPGHLIGGVDRIGLGNTGLMVVRTDPDGAFTTTADFNNTYELMDAAGHNFNFNAGQVVEFSDGTGYGIMGSYSYYDPASGIVLGIGYIRLNTSGTPLSIMGYAPNSSSSYSLRLTATTESITTPGDIFATAHFVESGEASYLLVMRINQNGGLLWGYTYDFLTTNTSFETPEDIIESPYNNNEVIVVGGVWYPGNISTPDDESGFTLELNNATGAVVNIMDFDSGPAVEQFSGIAVSNDPAAPGFIICGYTDGYHVGDGWVLKTDQNLSVQWSYLYADGVTLEMKPYEVAGRLNTFGKYEYYVTGRIDQTFMDAFIFKIDEYGQPVNPGALFVYETGSAFAHWGNSVDVNTSGTADGVSMYGQWEDPYGSPVYRRSYLVKAYFNGLSGCNESFRNINHSNHPVSITTYSASISPIKSYRIPLVVISFNNDQNLCYSQTISGGDNSFQTSINSVNGKEHALALFPNPFSSGDHFVTLQIYSQNNEAANLSIIDMLGRHVYNSNYQLATGDNKLMLNLGNLELSKGVYQVVVHKASGNETIKLSVN